MSDDSFDSFESSSDSSDSLDETLTIKSLKPASHLVSKTFDQEVLQFWKKNIEPELERDGSCYVDKRDLPDNVYLQDLETLGEILGYETSLHDDDFYDRGEVLLGLSVNTKFD